MSLDQEPAKDQRRWFAVEFNNQAWDLIESAELTEEQKWLLVHTAHASVRHWHDIGTEINKLRGEILLATAYTRVGIRELPSGMPSPPFNGMRNPRLEFPVRGEETTITPFDSATVYGALLKAHRINTGSKIPHPIEELKNRLIETLKSLPKEEQNLAEQLYLNGN